MVSKGARLAPVTASLTGMVTWVTWRRLRVTLALFSPEGRAPQRNATSGRQGVSMTLSSRPRSHARWTSRAPWALAPLALMLMLGAGCTDKHIGRPCDL